MLTPQDIYEEIDNVTLLNISNIILRNTILPRHLDVRHPDDNSTYLLRAMHQVSRTPHKDPRLEDAIKTVNYLINTHPSLCAMTNSNNLFNTPLGYAANTQKLLVFCEPICLALGEQLGKEDPTLRINLLVTALRQEKPAMIAALTKAGTSLRAALCTIVAAYRYTDSGVQLALSQLTGVVNKPDKEGKTALFYATTPEQIHALIRMGAKITHQDNKGRTPLFYAATLAVVQALLYENTATAADTQPKPRININHQDKSGRTALHLVNSSDIAEYLCQHPNINLTLATTKGKTALHCAFQRTVVANEKEQQADQKQQKKETAISFALQKHYRVSDDQKKETAIFFTLWQHYQSKDHGDILQSLVSSPEFLHKLLSTFPYTEFKDTDKYKQLEPVITYALTVLTTIPGRINEFDKSGYTALYFACRAADPSPIRLILQHNANHIVDSEGNTYLHVLTEICLDFQKQRSHSGYYKDELNACLALLQDLCQQQPTIINLQNMRGDTPLTLALRSNNLKLIKILIELGANPGIPNCQNNNTAIHEWVTQSSISSNDTRDVAPEDRNLPTRSLNILALLLLATTDEGICLQDANGQTALHLAIQGGDFQAIQCLIMCCPRLLDIANTQGKRPSDLVATLTKQDETSSLIHDYFQKELPVMLAQPMYQDNSDSSTTWQKRATMLAWVHQLGLEACNASLTQPISIPQIRGDWFRLKGHWSSQHGDHNFAEMSEYSAKADKLRGNALKLLKMQQIIYPSQYRLLVSGPKPIAPMSHLTTSVQPSKPTSSMSSSMEHSSAGISYSLPHTFLPPPSSSSSTVAKPNPNLNSSLTNS